MAQNTIDQETKEHHGLIAVGERAPAFTLPDQSGSAVSLSDFAGKSNVVVFFYPKAMSPGCTAEACAFRDGYEAFREAGAEVIGISIDSVEAQNKFAERNRFQFRLLADKDGKVWKAYGIQNTFGLIRGRVTFVIDKGGIIRNVFSSQLLMDKHVSEALEVLKRLG